MNEHIPTKRLVHLAQELKLPHDNKNWVRHIVALDKTKKDGYSLVGEFLNAETNFIGEGLYLICLANHTLDLEKKWGRNVYVLAKIASGGALNVVELQRLEGGGRVSNNYEGRDWAIRMWPMVEEFLSAWNGPRWPLSEEMATEGAVLVRDLLQALDGLQGQMNWAASSIDAKTVKAVNEVPRRARAFLEKYTGWVEYSGTGIQSVEPAPSPEPTLPEGE